MGWVGASALPGWGHSLPHPRRGPQSQAAHSFALPPVSALGLLVPETHPEALFTLPSRAAFSSHPLPLQPHSTVQPLLFLGTLCPPGGHLCF